MNQFEHYKTIIVKSDLDFTKMKNAESISQQAKITGSIRFPKDPEKTPKIRCEIEFSMGSPAEELYIYLKIRCIFTITQLDDRETLDQDINSVCRSKALLELDSKLAALTELHLGNAIHIPGLDDES